MGLTSLVVVERSGTQPLSRQVGRLLVLSHIVVFGTVDLVLWEGERQNWSYWCDWCRARRFVLPGGLITPCSPGICSADSGSTPPRVVELEQPQFSQFGDGRQLPHPSPTPLKCFQTNSTTRKLCLKCWFGGQEGRGTNGGKGTKWPPHLQRKHCGLTQPRYQTLENLTKKSWAKSAPLGLDMERSRRRRKHFSTAASKGLSPHPHSGAPEMGAGSQGAGWVPGVRGQGPAPRSLGSSLIFRPPSMHRYPAMCERVTASSGR